MTHVSAYKSPESFESFAHYHYTLTWTSCHLTSPHSSIASQCARLVLGNVAGRQVSWVLCFSLAKCLFTHLSLRPSYQLIDRLETKKNLISLQTLVEWRHFKLHHFSLAQFLKFKFTWNNNIFKDTPKSSSLYESVTTRRWRKNTVGRWHRQSGCHAVSRHVPVWLILDFNCITFTYLYT